MIPFVGERLMMASPVFKKRFARRKTTHRPFTFARNFENEETPSAAKGPIVSQVGDRGVVITSPVQLSKSTEGLTISDIVRQSPVPVLIAHSTPREKQKEQSKSKEEEDEDEANTSLLRRSFRSREPSEQFLSRRQYPHGTPQHAKSPRAPDEYYIGSKNTSNIDAEVSFTDEGGQTRGGSRKGLSASSSRASKQKARGKGKSTDPPLSASGKLQSRDGSKSAGSRSGAKEASAQKTSSRKATSASSATASSTKGRGQAVLDRTPSPVPTAQQDHRNSSSSRAKKPAPSSLSKRSKEDSVPSSSIRSQKSTTQSKTPPPSLSKGKKAGSVTPSGGQSKALTAKRTSSQPRAKRDRGETVAQRSVDTTLSLKKNGTVALRSVDKTLSQNKNRSFLKGNKDQVSSEENGDLSATKSSKNRSLLQRGKQKALPQREKENRPFKKDKQATSSPPSVRGRRNKTAESTSIASRTEYGSDSESGMEGGDPYEVESSLESSKRSNLSEEDTRIASSAAKKRKASAVKSVHSNVGARLSAVKENQRGSKVNNSSKNGNTSSVDARGKDYESAKTSAVRRKKQISHDENGLEALGPSPEKRPRNAPSQKTDTNVTENQSARDESCPSSSLESTRSRRGKQLLLTTPNIPSAKKNQRQNLQAKNLSQNSSLANSRLTQGGVDVHLSASRSKSRQTPQTSKLNTSHKSVISSAKGSPKNVVANQSVRGRTSPRRTSNSFWKTSHRNDSSMRPKRQQPVLSQSSYVTDIFEERKASSSNTAVSQKVTQKGASRSHPAQQRSDRSEDGEEGPKRPRPVVMELSVIVNMLEDTEDDLMEETTMSKTCQSMVHKAFTFTKKQLQETDSQLKQIGEMDYQVNKLKAACKDLSSRSKEKLHQKFILQKELQSVKSRGIDADIMQIDQWMQDFQHLRQGASS